MAVTCRPLTIDRIDPKYVQILFSQIEFRDNGCWVWTGCRRRGYGVVNFTAIDHSPILVHRLMYAWLVAPLPRDLVIYHFVCDNPPCCNPACAR